MNKISLSLPCVLIHLIFQLFSLLDLYMQKAIDAIYNNMVPLPKWVWVIPPKNSPGVFINPLYELIWIGKLIIKLIKKILFMVKGNGGSSPVEWWEENRQMNWDFLFWRSWVWIFVVFCNLFCVYFPVRSFFRRREVTGEQSATTQ
jgi:hypothetical protein